MFTSTSFLLASSLLSLAGVHAHGHSHGENYDAHGAEESGMSYAERHVSRSFSFSGGSRGTGADLDCGLASFNLANR